MMLCVFCFLLFEAELTVLWLALDVPEVDACWYCINEL